jgi:glycosyltransferase involved in cell wall biosynthesis
MSDSPTSPTGLGNVTRTVCSGLGELGHEVSILGWQKDGQPQRLQRYTIYPTRTRNAEPAVLFRLLRKLKPHVLITLADPWRMGYIAQARFADLMSSDGFVWAYYYPIDTDMGSGRLPPSTVHLLQAVDLPISMSAYGRRLAQSNGVESAYIPHGVNTDLFSPPDNKAAAKDALGYRNRFVVLSDARNQIRKLLPRTLEIFRRFAEDKKDAILHLHCDPYDFESRTKDYYYDLISDIRFLGLTDKVRFTRGFTINRGTSWPRLAMLYQGADVHLLSSFGEGFGIPTLQAAAAGVVPMASAYTASHELVRGHGEPIRVEKYLRDGWGLRRALIDIDDAVEKLERLYQDRTYLESKSEASRRFAQSYNWKRIITQWHELLTREVPRLREKKHLKHSRPLNAKVSTQSSNLDYALKNGLPAEIK